MTAQLWTMYYNGQQWTISDELYNEMRAMLLHLNRQNPRPAMVEIPFDDESGSHSLFYSQGAPIHFSART